MTHSAIKKEAATKKTPAGVKFFAKLSCFFAVAWLLSFGDYNYYQSCFPGTLGPLMKWRFALSCGMRVLMFISGIGLLMNKNFARKLTLLWAFFQVCSLPWKHPHLELIRIADHLAPRIITVSPWEEIYAPASPEKGLPAPKYRSFPHSHAPIYHRAQRSMAEQEREKGYQDAINKLSLDLSKWMLFGMTTFDGVFAVVVIYYFTRPKIKEHFL